MLALNIATACPASIASISSLGANAANAAAAAAMLLAAAAGSFVLVADGGQHPVEQHLRERLVIGSGQGARAGCGSTARLIRPGSGLVTCPPGNAMPAALGTIEHDDGGLGFREGAMALPVVGVGFWWISARAYHVLDHPIGVALSGDGCGVRTTPAPARASIDARCGWCGCQAKGLVRLGAGLVRPWCGWCGSRFLPLVRAWCGGRSLRSFLVRAVFLQKITFNGRISRRSAQALVRVGAGHYRLPLRSVMVSPSQPIHRATFSSDRRARKPFSSRSRSRHSASGGTGCANPRRTHSAYQMVSGGPSRCW